MNETNRKATLDCYFPDWQTFVWFEQTENICFNRFVNWSARYLPIEAANGSYLHWQRSEIPMTWSVAVWILSVIFYFSQTCILPTWEVAFQHVMFLGIWIVHLAFIRKLRANEKIYWVTTNHRNPENEIASNGGTVEWIRIKTENYLENNNNNKKTDKKWTGTRYTNGYLTKWLQKCRKGTRNNAKNQLTGNRNETNEHELTKSTDKGTNELKI